MVQTVSLVPQLWPKHTRNGLYRKYTYHMNKSRFQHFQISPQTVDKLFPHPVGVFCSLLEPRKWHIMQRKSSLADFSAFVISLDLKLVLVEGLPIGPVWWG